MTERENPLTRVIRALDDAMKAAKDANDLLDTIAPPPETELATAEDWYGVTWYSTRNEQRCARLSHTVAGLRSNDLIVVKRKDWEEARGIIGRIGNSLVRSTDAQARDFYARTEPKP